MPARRLDRRQFLGTVAGSIVAMHAPRVSARAPMRFIALGQALIQRELASQKYPGYAEIRARLQGADIVFSNFEAAIKRDPAALDVLPASQQPVTAAPATLDSLREMSINLLSLANNHADDFGEAGFLATIDEAKKRGFGVAGTGRNIVEASQAGYLTTRAGTAALVAMASSAVPESAMATDRRAGVNHVSLLRGTVDPIDAERTLNAIKLAAGKADWVFVYQHDHYWERDWQVTPEWKKAWCRSCIDAGATAFVSHGAPLLHGIEIYKGRPIFYGLGNFVFQIALHLGRVPPAPYTETRCWQSVIARCRFEDGVIRSLDVDPITLKSDRGVGEGGYSLHGNPRLADGQEAEEILMRLQSLSKPFGTDLDISGGVGSVRLAR